MLVDPGMRYPGTLLVVVVSEAKLTDEWFKLFFSLETFLVVSIEFSIRRLI